MKNLTNEPKWNEVLIMYNFFPSLIRLIKIELCSKDTFGETVLATEYLDIDEISEFEEGYFLPTFGPCGIDLYTEPNNLRIKQGPLEDDANLNFNVLNENMIDGCCCRPDPSEKFEMPRAYISVSGSCPGGGAYAARLFMGINSFEVEKKNTRLYENQRKKKKKVYKVENGESGLKMKSEEFLAFLMIGEATMIDPRLKDDLSFRLGFGKILTKKKDIISKKCLVNK